MAQTTLGMFLPHTKVTLPAVCLMMWPGTADQDGWGSTQLQGDKRRTASKEAGSYQLVGQRAPQCCVHCSPPGSAVQLHCGTALLLTLACVASQPERPHAHNTHDVHHTAPATTTHVPTTGSPHLLCMFRQPVATQITAPCCLHQGRGATA